MTCFASRSIIILRNVSSSPKPLQLLATPGSVLRPETTIFRTRSPPSDPQEHHSAHLFPLLRQDLNVSGLWSVSQWNSLCPCIARHGMSCPDAPHGWKRLCCQREPVVVVAAEGPSHDSHSWHYSSSHLYHTHSNVERGAWVEGRAAVPGERG